MRLPPCGAFCDCQLAGLGQLEERELDQDAGEDDDQHDEADESDALKAFLPLPHLTRGRDVLEHRGIVGKGGLVERDRIGRRGGREVVPRVSLGRLVNDTAAAVGGVIPGIGLSRGALLQESHAVGRGDIVLVTDCAALDGGIVEEEFVILGADLAHRAAAAERVSRRGVDADKGRVHKVRALGQAAGNLAHTALGSLHLVKGERERTGEATHRVSGHTDQPVAVLILEHIGLVVHILYGVVHGVGPERQPNAKEAGVGIDAVIQCGVAVVILVQRQNDKAAARKLDGVRVLHFRGVEIAVRHDHRRLGVVRRGILRHIEQTAETAVSPVEGNARYFCRADARVEQARQRAAEQDQYESNA